MVGKIWFDLRERKGAGILNVACFPQKLPDHRVFFADLQTSRKWEVEFKKA